MSRLDDLEAKKQLLIAQAEFDRLKFAMAMHDVRRIVRPAVATSSARPASHSTASRLLGFVLPVLGASRSGAWFARCRSRCRSIGCCAAGAARTDTKRHRKVGAPRWLSGVTEPRSRE